MILWGFVLVSFVMIWLILLVSVVIVLCFIRFDSLLREFVLLMLVLYLLIVVGDVKRVGKIFFFNCVMFMFCFFI